MMGPWTLISLSRLQSKPSYGIFDVPSDKIFTSNLSGIAYDDDDAGITISTLDCVDGEEVSEFGRECDLQIVLDSESTSEVIIELGFNDSSEAIFFPMNSTSNEFAFSTSNWSTPRNFSLKGLDDYEYERSLFGDEENSYKITPFGIVPSSISSSDSVYSAISSSSSIITLHNLDNEPFVFSIKQGGSFLPLAGEIQQMNLGMLSLLSWN